MCFEPEVTIRIDYHGKRFDKSHGSLAGILMCLAQLNSAELKLKRLRTRNGLLGFEKVLMFLVHEWKTDILKNQLQGILGGVGPMHTFLQISKSSCETASQFTPSSFNYCSQFRGSWICSGSRSNSTRRTVAS